MIDVGLIGFGLGGKAFHAPVIAAVEGLRLAAVLERHGNTAADIYPGVKIVRTAAELLAIQSIRLVAIATPNDTHFSYVRACLEADRDVVVDKPFATTLREARELAELARQRGRLLTVYQERRLDGDFLTMKQLISGGELGRVVHFEETFDRCRVQVRDSWKERMGLSFAAVVRFESPTVSADDQDRFRGLALSVAKNLRISSSVLRSWTPASSPLNAVSAT